MRAGTAGAPQELGSAIELALRAAAWSRIAGSETITAAALDEVARETRARWSETIDTRVRAIAAARGLDQAVPIAPQPEPPARADETPRGSTVIAPLAMRLPPWRATPRVTDPDVRWETGVLFDAPVDHEENEPGPESWTSATARCRACHREYELAWDDPVALARCGCGAVGLQWIAVGTPDDEDVGDAVACRSCARFFLRRARTLHACCPFCLRIDVPLLFDV